MPIFNLYTIILNVFEIPELPPMATLESTSLPNIACVPTCNSATAFSNVISKVSQNIDRNEERAQESELKDCYSIEWKQVHSLRFT